MNGTVKESMELFHGLRQKGVALLGVNKLNLPLRFGSHGLN